MTDKIVTIRYLVWRYEGTKLYRGSTTGQWTPDVHKAKLFTRYSDASKAVSRHKYNILAVEVHVDR